MDERREQLLMHVSFALGALVDEVVSELPDTTQRLIAHALERGGNLVVMSTMIPQPEFHVTLTVPPDNHPVELAHCAPPLEAFQCGLVAQ